MSVTLFETENWPYHQNEDNQLNYRILKKVKLTRLKWQKTKVKVLHLYKQRSFKGGKYIFFLALFLYKITTPLIYDLCIWNRKYIVLHNTCCEKTSTLSARHSTTFTEANNEAQKVLRNSNSTGCWGTTDTK